MNERQSNSKALMWSSVLLLTGLLSGCGGGGGGNGVSVASFANRAGSAGTATVGSTCTGAACVSLGTAANYVILAKTGVSTVPGSVVTGNIGLSPAARTGLTGWSLITEPTDTYFTSSQVVAPGKLYAADNVGGTTSVDLTTAVGDMQAAYTAAAGKAGGPCPGVGIFGAAVPPLAPGVYTCAVPVTIPTNFTLNGNATDVWVFQITGTVTQSASTQVILTGGALPKNVFWQASGTVAIGTNALMQGVILGQTNITVGTGATVNGRLLAQTAVTLGMATITVP